MKHLPRFSKLLALVLSIVLGLGLCMPALAADQNTVSITLSDSSIEKSAAAQTVTLNIVASAPVSVDSLEYGLELPEGWTSGAFVLPSGFTGYDWTNNKLNWYSTLDGNLDNQSDLGSVVINVPANAEVGEYVIKIKGFCASADMDYWVDGADYTTKLTIEEVSNAPGAYSAAISANPTTIAVGDTVYVKVTASGEAFASSEVTITYDSAKLEYKEITGLGNKGQASDAATGKLKIVDTGDPKVKNEYVISFEAIADGVVDLSLLSAKFSTKTNAATKDLAEATITTDSVKVTIEKAAFNVTLPGDWFTGNTTVANGGDYTFTASKWANYDYGTVSYTVGGGETNTVTPDENGKYTIEDVKGDVVITMEADPTPKQYNVTIVGDTAANDGEKATYNTPYKFTLPEDKAPDVEKGYTYTLTSVKIGGTTYTGYTVEGKVYTIPGTAITGDIEITITKTDVDANQFTVTVTGSGAGEATVVKTPVNKGESASITLAKDEDYTYTVTATMGGETVQVTDTDPTFVVGNVSANVVFTVEKALIVDSASVSQYISLDETQMWLVKFGDEKLTGEVYAYGGDQMFWSEEYGAYCYLVISDTMPSITSDKFAIIAGTAVEIDYEMDVNKTGKVDANDAQFVYNMYNAEYAEFTEDVTVEKFLRADVNGNGVVDVEDAAAIVSFLLGA